MEFEQMSFLMQPIGNESWFQDLPMFQAIASLSQINEIQDFIPLTSIEDDFNPDSSSTQHNSSEISESGDTTQILQTNASRKRTSNTSLKPIFTCLKRVLLRLDDSFSGFFRFFMKKNQNAVRKQFFQEFLSFAQFQRISVKGSETKIEDVLNKQRNQFEKLIQKQLLKGQTQRADQTRKFVDLFYEALKYGDYKRRMQILFDGRKHNLSHIEAKRKQFKQFKPKKK